MKNVIASDADVVRFREAAERFVRENASTKADARRTLVRLGTHTEAGEITPEYDR
jgi:hypothetical protein